MPFCSDCGTKLVENAKFCQKCGSKIGYTGNPSHHRHIFAGKVYKCPNCGEALDSFLIRCPSCGIELRGTKATTSVREFALKLEAIEAQRGHATLGDFFRELDNDAISKTDSQKISLIQSFSVPNNREDMLEFMILATSNIDFSLFGKTEDENKGLSELSRAWYSKVKQVYEKAKRSYRDSEEFYEIESLYEDCLKKVNTQKRVRTVKWFLLIGFIVVFIISTIIGIPVYERYKNKIEDSRLEEIVNKAQSYLSEGQYNIALLYAESIEYDGSKADRERFWAVYREELIYLIINKAAENGVVLERSNDKAKSLESITDALNTHTGGFAQGFMDGLEPGLEAAKETYEEFLKILSGESNN